MPEYCIFEADQFFVDKDGNYNFDRNLLGAAHNWCRDKVEIAMKREAHAESGNVWDFDNYCELCVSNTSTTEKEIKPYIDLANKYGYKIVSLIVEKRHNNVNIHGVPQESVDAMELRLKNNIKLI